MLITDVRAHHIRIPYDAGVASFRQGASAISALEIVMVEVSTDAGITGWGDAFAYVCPRTSRTAVEEMIAPQAQGQRSSRCGRKFPPSWSRSSAICICSAAMASPCSRSPALDIALWDLAAKSEGRAAAPADRRREARADSRLCEPAADRQARR